MLVNEEHPGLLIIEQFKMISLRRLPADPRSLMGAALIPAVDEPASSSDNSMSVSISSKSQRNDITSPLRRAAGAEAGSARKLLVRCKTSPMRSSNS
jgi:hypothetical protein